MRRFGNTFSEVEFYRMISEPRDVASRRPRRTIFNVLSFWNVNRRFCRSSNPAVAGPKDRGHCRRDAVESSDIRSGKGSGHRQPSCS
jgi:hypothetical protein